MQELLLYITLALGFAPATLIMCRGRKRLQSFKGIDAMVWLTAFASLYEIVFSIGLQWKAIHWFHIYTALEFVCIVYFFNSLFGAKFRITNFFICGCFALLWVWWSFFRFSWGSLTADTYVVVIETIYVYTFGFLFFRDIFMDLTVPYLWKYAPFYYVSAFLIYFSGNFFLFFLSDLMWNTPGLQIEEYWNLNILVSLVVRVLLLVGLFKEAS